MSNSLGKAVYYMVSPNHPGGCWERLIGCPPCAFQRALPAPYGERSWLWKWTGEGEPPDYAEEIPVRYRRE